MELERIISLLANTFAVRESDLSLETGMEEIEGWDSLSHMEMIADLENEYGFEFTTEEIMKMITIGSVIKIVEDKLNK